jgi:hypothetical protein
MQFLQKFRILHEAVGFISSIMGNFNNVNAKACPHSRRQR